MKMEYCLYILDVAETGSIRQAAEKRYITQQGLSQAIRSVERELGVDIFSRTGNRIQITAAGQVVVDQMKRIADDYQNLLISVSRQAGGQEENQITIYYTSTVGAMYMSNVLERLTTRYPRLHLKMYSIGASDDLYQREYGPDMIGIFGTPKKFAEAFRRSGDSRRVFHTMTESRLLCMMSRLSPYAGRRVITTEDLPSIPFGVFDDEDNMIVDQLGSPENANITFSGSNYSLYMDLISKTRTMGFATRLTEYYFRRQSVVYIPYEPETVIEYGCMTCAGPLSPVVEDCLEIVREELEKFNAVQGEKTSDV